MCHTSQDLIPTATHGGGSIIAWAALLPLSLNGLHLQWSQFFIYFFPLQENGEALFRGNVRCNAFGNFGNCSFVH